MGGQGFQWGRESDLGGLKSGEGVLNKMQMPQSHTILWEEGRWASSLVSCVGRDAGMLKVLNQVQGTERGLSVKQPTIWGVQQSLAHAGSALGPVAWSLHSLCHTPMPTPPPPRPWCPLPDAQMSQGATCRSLQRNLAGTSQASGGAREGEGLTPRQIMGFHGRPTKGGVFKLRRWAAKGLKGEQHFKPTDQTLGNEEPPTPKTVY